MKIENQVCPLEKSKKLAVLGITTTTLFQWNEYAERSNIILTADNDEPDRAIGYWEGPIESMRLITYGEFKGTYPAFNTAELGVMLPDRFLSVKCSDKYDKEKGKHFVHSPIVGECARQYGETEAEARAAMLIYLLETNKTSAIEVNQRLLSA